MIRQGWIDAGETMAVVQQYVLAGVCRATLYAQHKPPVVDASDLLHSRLIDEEYAPQEIPLGDTRHPFYGSRKRVIFLKTGGHLVNRKRVRRLMQQMGLCLLYTSRCV